MIKTLIHKMLLPQIDKNVLKLTFKNTLSNRATEFILDIKDDVLSDLSTDGHITDLWSEYAKTYSFATNISYLECIIAIKSFLNLVL